MKYHNITVDVTGDKIRVMIIVDVIDKGRPNFGTSGRGVLWFSKIFPRGWKDLDHDIQYRDIEKAVKTKAKLETDVTPMITVLWSGNTVTHVTK